MKQLSVPVRAVEELMPGTFQMWLTAPELSAEAKSGQFLMVRCGDETVLRRPLSVHAVSGDSLALLFAVRGKGTEWLSKRQGGQKLDVFGLMGNGFALKPRTKNLLLVAGGIGIAPLFHLVDCAVEDGKKVTLLLGAATAAQLYHTDLLPDGVKTIVATEDGSAGYRGMVTDLLPVNAPTADQIIACGPLPMYRHMATEQKRLGIQGKAVQISLEMRMGCGVGVCYGCTIRTKSGLKQVCKDGPVFNLDEVIWDDFTRC